MTTTRRNAASDQELAPDVGSASRRQHRWASPRQLKRTHLQSYQQRMKSSVVMVTPSPWRYTRRPWRLVAYRSRREEIRLDGKDYLASQHPEQLLQVTIGLSLHTKVHQHSTINILMDTVLTVTQAY